MWIINSNTHPKNIKFICKYEINSYISLIKKVKSSWSLNKLCKDQFMQLICIFHRLQHIFVDLNSTKKTETVLAI